MPYKIEVIDRKDRKARIDEEKGKSSQQERFTYRNKDLLLPVVRLPLNLPIYRMKNFRTSVEQGEYIRETGKNANFFMNGEENATAQAAQHKILLKMSKDSRGDIFGELEHVKVQNEPLLLTAHGVVVNGNRRLAAMRELYTQDDLFKSFSHIDAVILPEAANSVDIDLIESELQMRPETKLEYEWIPRRLKLRYEIHELKIDRAQIKDIYRFKRDPDINKELQQLDLVDEYLAFIESPGQYKLVEQSEQIFKELQATLKDKTPEAAQKSRQVAFLLIKHGSELGRRVYDYRDAFGKDLDRVLEQLAIENNIELPETSVVEEIVPETNNDDPLAGLDKKPSRRYEPLNRFLQNSSKSKGVAEHIARIHDSVKEEKKEEDRKNAGLKSAQDANRSLHSINLSECDPNTFSGILAQLDGAINQAEKIKGEIEKMLRAQRKKQK